MSLAFSSLENNPIARAIIQTQAKVPDTFNVNIHANDEMFSYLCNAYGNQEQALVKYFTSGREMLNAVTYIINWKFSHFQNVSAFLDFACGYGRFTRFLIQEFPARRVWVSDIDANAVQFQKEQFGVNGIVSFSRPEDYPVERKYDAIFVASLFSHLPEKLFVPWLEKLYSMLSDNGVLMFSVHDEDIMTPDMVMPTSGIYFANYSESRYLDNRDYGTTWVTESFVAGAIAKASQGKAKYHRIKRGLLIQDLYVVINAADRDFSDFNFGLKPRGYLDSCILTKPNELTLSGWATDTSTLDGSTTEIEVIINGRIVQKCMPFLPRPDVVEVIKNERSLISGWTCSCYLGSKSDFSQDILTLKMKSKDNIERILHFSTVEAALNNLRY